MKKKVFDELDPELMEVWRETGMQSRYHAMDDDYISPIDRIRLLEAQVEAICKHFDIDLADVPAHIEVKEKK